MNRRDQHNEVPAHTLQREEHFTRNQKYANRNSGSSLHHITSTAGLKTEISYSIWEKEEIDFFFKESHKRRAQRTYQSHGRGRKLLGRTTTPIPTIFSTKTGQKWLETELPKSVTNCKSRRERGMAAEARKGVKEHALCESVASRAMAMAATGDQTRGRASPGGRKKTPSPRRSLTTSALGSHPREHSRFWELPHRLHVRFWALDRWSHYPLEHIIKQYSFSFYFPFIGWTTITNAKCPCC